MATGSRSRRNPRRRGGGGISGVIFGVLLLGGLFAFFQIPVDPSITGLSATLQARSDQVEAWVRDTVDSGGANINIPSAPAPGTYTLQPVSETRVKLETLKVADASGVSYNRDEWKHWTDVRSCWNTRDQVLSDEAVSGSVTYLDSNKVTTTDANKACYISGGVWNDPYTGQQYTNPEDLDIDHMIPLNYAAQHGGQEWDASKKEQYANYRDYPNHLIAVQASANRSKSDQGPSAWKPENQSYWCAYATDWVNISAQWQLSVTEADKNALSEMLNTCPA